MNANVNEHAKVNNVSNQKTDRERKEGKRLADKKKEARKQESNEDILSMLYKKFGR